MPSRGHPGRRKMRTKVGPEEPWSVRRERTERMGLCHWVEIRDEEGVLNVRLERFFKCWSEEAPAWHLARTRILVHVTSLASARNKELRWRNRWEGGSLGEAPEQPLENSALEVVGKAGVELAGETSS